MKSGLFFALTLFFALVGVSTASAQTSCCNKSTAAAVTKAQTPECNSKVGNLPFLNQLPAAATATAASNNQPANCIPICPPCPPQCEAKGSASTAKATTTASTTKKTECCTKGQSAAKTEKAEAPAPVGGARLL